LILFGVIERRRNRVLAIAPVQRGAGAGELAATSVVVDVTFRDHRIHQR
jgi:hypothetical protein